MNSGTRTLTQGAFALIASGLAMPIVYAQGGVPTDIELKQNDFRSAMVNILNYVLTFVGLIAVAMLIYGGFVYLTSSGNEEQTRKAKSIILYAIIGIIVIALSFVIVNTIISAGKTVIGGDGSQASN
jgi:cytochrome bd-type quinol oxidase subunit 2